MHRPSVPGTTAGHRRVDSIVLWSSVGRQADRRSLKPAVGSGRASIVGPIADDSRCGRWFRDGSCRPKVLVADPVEACFEPFVDRDGAVVHGDTARVPVLSVEPDDADAVVDDRRRARSARTT